ncbi:hypothetical protein ACOSQ2_009797 [Xanthoceras sorbifolium]
MSLSSFSSNDVAGWWRFLWSLKIPAKVKLFLWRVFPGWVPSLCKLFEKKVANSAWCPLCDRHDESILHAIWGCKSLHSVREACGFMALPAAGDFIPIRDFLVGCQRLHNSSAFELLSVMWWRSWFRRNKLIRKEGVFPAEEVVQ